MAMAKSSRLILLSPSSSSIELIEAKAELGRALARLDRGGRRDRRPVEVVRLLHLLEGERRRLGGRRLDALLGHVLEVGAAVLAKQAAGADHEQAALYT